MTAEIVVMLKKGKFSLDNPHLTVSTHTLWSDKRPYFCLPRLFVIQTSLKRKSGIKGSQYLCIEDVQNHKRPTEITASPNLLFILTIIVIHCIIFIKSPPMLN